MKSIPDYLDLARERAGFISDRRLAEAIGVSQSWITQVRTKRMLPGDHHMLRWVLWRRGDR
jgi:predicted transcriptional regulator